MSKIAGVKNNRLNLKLILCLVGIVLVIVILIAMRPLPTSQRTVSASPNPSAAKNLSNSGVSAVGQAAPAVQTATSTGLATSASPQVARVNYSASNSLAPLSVPPAQPNSTPPADPDTPLYPIDPIPCKNMYVRNGSCYPRCPDSGIEMMCASPL